MSPEQLAGRRGRLPLRSLCARRRALPDGDGRQTVRHPAAERAQPRDPAAASYADATARATASRAARAHHRHAARQASRHRYQSAGTLAADLAALGRAEGTCRRPSAPATRARRRWPSCPSIVDWRRRCGDRGVARRPGSGPSSRLSRHPRISGWRHAPRPARWRASRFATSAAARRRDGARGDAAENRRPDSRHRDARSMRRTRRPMLPTIAIDRRVDDPLATQDDIAGQVCDGLRAVVSRVPGRRYTQDPDAYHAFKRGQHHWKSCFAGGWRPAIEHFQHAIDRDPQFALAHVALANAYNFLGFYSSDQAQPGICRRRTSGRAGAGHRHHAGAAFVELALAKLRRRLGLGRRRTRVQARPCPRRRQSAGARLLFVAADAARPRGRRARRGAARARARALVAAGGRRPGPDPVSGRPLRRSVSPCAASAFASIRATCSPSRSGPLLPGASRCATRPSPISSGAATLSRRAPFYLGLLGHCYGQFGMREEALALSPSWRTSPPIHTSRRKA